MNVKGVICKRAQSWLGVVSSQGRSSHLCHPAALIISWSSPQHVGKRPGDAHVMQV